MPKTYKDGLIAGMDYAIKKLDKIISDSKKRNPKQNTPQQIHNSARVKAYYELKGSFEGNKAKIIANPKLY